MDKNRRKFLKVVLLGSGLLIVGKILDPLFSKFFHSSILDNDYPKKDPPNNPMAFKVIEDNKTLSIYDASGEEVFQIDKSNG